MIETKYYAIGFIVYLVYMIFTFNIYSKKREMSNFFILFAIFFYYTLLAGYIINLVDNSAEFYEKLVQIGIYAIGGALFLYLHYESNIKIKDDEKAINYKSKN